MSVPDDDLLAAIMAASRALVAVAAVSLESAPAEVTLMQYRALVVLVLGGPVLMSALGKRLKLSPSSTTRLVERLERKALVARQPSPTSRRSTEVYASESGRQLVDTVMKRREEELRLVISAIPERRHQPLLRAFEDFARAAGEPLLNPVTSV